MFREKFVGDYLEKKIEDRADGLTRRRSDYLGALQYLLKFTLSTPGYKGPE